MKLELLPAAGALDTAADLLAVGVGEDFAAGLEDLDRRYGGHLLPLLKQRGFTGKRGSVTVVPSLGRVAARDVAVIGWGKRSADAIAKAAGRAGRQARELGARSVALLFGEVDEELLRNVLESVLAGNYAYDRYKPEADRMAPLESVFLPGPPRWTSRDLEVRARWQFFARDLVNAPAAEIFPVSLAERAGALAKLPNVSVEVWNLDRLRSEKCAGIVAVGQGSTNPPCLVHVRYRPTDARGHVALVGKGVTFDSGGLSLKPSASMQTMRCDMAGAATVFAALGAASELGLPLAVDAIVPAVENMNSGSSYKLGDILTYRNGVTVEIHNTDAEGRLVLADGLIEACREPGVTDVIDVATLTGAVVVAIGPDFTGLYTSDDALAAELQRAAASNSEGLWRMPLHEPYRQLLKGDWAQIKNVTGKTDAGSITAALFLQHFVEGKRWAHLDVAGSAFHEKANGIYAPGGTGQMVRSLVSWLEMRAASA